MRGNSAEELITGKITNSEDFQLWIKTIDDVENYIKGHAIVDIDTFPLKDVSDETLRKFLDGKCATDQILVLHATDPESAFFQAENTEQALAILSFCKKYTTASAIFCWEFPNLGCIEVVKDDFELFDSLLAVF